MRCIPFALILVAATVYPGGSAIAQFPQHFAAETKLPVWVWKVYVGGQVTPVSMGFSSRWYFEGRIKKPTSDLLLCVRGQVFEEQLPEQDGHGAQTGRVPQGPINLEDQPHVSAWASPAGFIWPQVWAGVPAIGAWNPYYLTARILPALMQDAVLTRTAPGIPGGVGFAKNTLIDGFQICLLIRLPVTGMDTGADFDGDAGNPLFSLVPNDAGNEQEVALASGDRITVQMDIFCNHIHNIHVSPSDSVFLRHISSMP